MGAGMTITITAHEFGPDGAPSQKQFRVDVPEAGETPEAFRQSVYAHVDYVIQQMRKATSGAQEP